MQGITIITRPPQKKDEIWILNLVFAVYLQNIIINVFSKTFGVSKGVSCCMNNKSWLFGVILRPTEGNFCHSITLTP